MEDMPDSSPNAAGRDDQAAVYDEQSIKVLEGLAAVRLCEACMRSADDDRGIEVQGT